MFSSKGENYNPCWGGKAYLKSDSCHPAPPPPTSVTIFHHPTLTGRNRKHYCVALTDPPRLRERKKYYWKQYEHSVVALDSLYVRINPRIQLCTTGYSNMNKISKILQLYTAASFSRVTPNQELNLFSFFDLLLQIASFVCKTSTDSAVLQRSLAILESMVLNSQDLYQKVAQEITIGQLMPHLQGYGELLSHGDPCSELVGPTSEITHHQLQ